MSLFLSFFVFFFNDTATTEIYTLSLHDLFRSVPLRPHQPIAQEHRYPSGVCPDRGRCRLRRPRCLDIDRKSTRLNSSHLGISYAVFCLKKKKKRRTTTRLVISE